MPSQRSTAVLITQQLINNKHHKRKFKLPLIISFDIHSNAFVILLWNSFWHLHRRLHGMRVFIYSLFVCTFSEFSFFFYRRWMMDLVRLPKLVRSPSRREAHIRKWRKFCVTLRIASDREKQRQYLHITTISVLFGCQLACCVSLTFPFQSRSLTASSLCLCSYASCFFFLLQVSTIKFASWIMHKNCTTSLSARL